LFGSEENKWREKERKRGMKEVDERMKGMDYGMEWNE